jgi:SAM-dependent methyltransferase
VNIDWSIYLRLKRSRLGSAIAVRVLNGDRLAKFNGLSSDLVLHDLRRGIPAESNSVDAVYHSHLLEHIGRPHVPGFLAEVWRVLKPGGVHRVVVPDWEKMCRAYLEDVDDCMQHPEKRDKHEDQIAAMIDQMVRIEAFGTSQQKPMQRRLENFVLGDANRRGELHRWMYDRISIESVLCEAAFVKVEIVDYMKSSIPDWEITALDRADDGSEYKPESLYVEALKP